MESRYYLIHLLTEAAEIEHNLLCSYLYAAFSLKSRDHGLTPSESHVVDEWRKSVVGVAIEEMGHLALVNNLLVAVGGAPRFDRPNFPIPPGYHPAGFVIRLMPFTKATLDHFIYLERPSNSSVEDGAGAYRDRKGPRRVPTPGGLTPSTPDYETIGEFYAAIRWTLIEFARDNEKAFFAASASRQLSSEGAGMPGLIIIRNLRDALGALDVIVEQGEGSCSEKSNCHFARFKKMRTEWSALEAANPDFAPFHNAAHDPVMRKPAKGVDRVWITEPKAARLLDLGNALYGVTLSLLQHSYAPTTNASEAKIGPAIDLMHAVALIGSKLTTIKATSQGIEFAGMTFEVPRNLMSGAPEDVLQILQERLAALACSDEAREVKDVVAILNRVAGTLAKDQARSRWPER